MSEINDNIGDAITLEAFLESGGDGQGDEGHSSLPKLGRRAAEKAKPAKARPESAEAAQESLPSVGPAAAAKRPRGRPSTAHEEAHIPAPRPIKYEQDGTDGDSLGGPSAGEAPKKPRFDKRTLIRKITIARERYKKELTGVILPSKSEMTAMTAEELDAVFSEIEFEATSMENTFFASVLPVACEAYEMMLTKLGVPNVQGVGAFLQADPTLKKAVDDLIFFSLPFNTWPPHIRIAFCVLTATARAIAVNKAASQAANMPDISDLSEKYADL